MDNVTLVIAVFAVVSELLPLIDFTRANGFLHGLKVIVMRCHAESDCNVEIEKK
jgi:hypothetical protein